ncbi:MAG: polysaccharide biosynthesis tyrosine autokinase, partial [Bacteroidota bacterium]|nr:polysaccharide biosynthesis tyrosine autokinase [Bacteroidota bacterium]
YLSNYLTKNIKEESIVAPSSLGVSDPTLLELVTQFNDLQLERSQIGEKNPNYKRVTENIEKIRQALFEVLKNVKAVNNLERKNFDQQCAEIQSEIDLLPAKEHQMINFERKYKINNNYYTFLLQKRSEAQIRKASNVSDNVVLQRARVTSLINGDKKSKTYITFLVIGLLIPFAFIILKELLNFTIRTETDLQKLTKYPIIGQIRHTNNLTPVLTVKSPKSAFTESFRVIRTRLEFITKRKTGVFIMVTSAEPHDGKTYFSANLSGVYGLSNQKVLLIDMDLRKPNVSKLFELSTTKGLVDYLINNATLDEIIKKDFSYGFDVILVGTVPPNPGDLIRSEELKQLLSQLKTMYDYIIFDTSPLGLVADAYTIAQMADANLIIVRSGKTNKNFFKNFISQINATNNLHNIYLVLNDIDVKKNGGYGYGYGNYGYGGYGYGYLRKRKKGSRYYYNSEDYYVNDIDDADDVKK